MATLIMNELPEIVCCLYATCPLLLPEDLRQAKQRLQENQHLHYVFSGVRFFISYSTCFDM